MKLKLKYLASKNSNKYIKYDNEKTKIVVALAADYGNLGDVAITYAQTNFLKKIFRDVEVIDFPISETFTEIKSLKKIINPDDIITIVGGGNTGDMYDDIEFCRQFVIQQFPNNRIVCFPQTIDFSETNAGQKALDRSRRIYGNHNRLSLSAREERSYNTFSQFFTKNKVVMAPDIVLSLDESKPSVKREGITLVLRADNEKNMSKDAQQELINVVSANYTVRFNDTHINRSRMTVDERKAELNCIWNIFRKSEIVITDRLHGMIFCAITNTPCIAIDNSNKKVSGVYNAWLKDISTIKVIEKLNADEVMKTIENLLTKYNNNNSNYISRNNFKGLIRLLKE